METTDPESGGLPAFVKDPKGLLRRRWRWMAAVLSVGVVATLVYVARIPVTYLATTTVLVTTQQIPSKFVESTVPENDFQRMNALIGELLSRERLTAVIEKHDPYPELRGKAPVSALVDMLRMNAAVRSQPGVGPGGNAGSNIYVISFRHENPTVAADVTNDLASLFVTSSSRVRGKQARLTTQFMRAELERTERSLKELDGQISDFKERHRGELPSELGSNTSRLERLSAQRESLRLQIGQAETRLSLLIQEGDSTSPNSPYARLSAVRAKLATEMAVNTDEHPNVIALKRQVEALEQELQQGGPAYAGVDPARRLQMETANRDIADMRRTLAAVDAQIAELEQRVAATPKLEEELTALERRATVMRESYLQNLRKVQAAELAESLESAQQGERVSVLDRALPPSEPELRRRKYMLMGLLASLTAAVGIGVLFELLDPVIVSGEQIERSFAVPVLGSIPKIS